MLKLQLNKDGGRNGFLKNLLFQTIIKTPNNVEETAEIPEKYCLANNYGKYMHNKLRKKFRKYPKI
jgi:hypothetical protein